MPTKKNLKEDVYQNILNFRGESYVLGMNETYKTASIFR